MTGGANAASLWVAGRKSENKWLGAGAGGGLGLLLTCPWRLEGACAQRYSCRVVGDKSLIQIITNKQSTDSKQQAEACLLLVTLSTHSHVSHSSQFFFFAADAFALTTMSGLAPNGATPVSAVNSGVKTMNATHAKRA